MPVVSGPRCNRRVRCTASPLNARSESVLAINQQNPYNIVEPQRNLLIQKTINSH